jgi:hypothetical protein
MKYAWILLIVFVACNKKEETNTSNEKTQLCRLVSWQDTLHTGALRNNTFEYNQYGNPVSLQSAFCCTAVEPDFFTYDSLQRLVEHRRLFTYQYLYSGSDTLPYAAIEVWPFGERHSLSFTYDSDRRVIKVVSDYIEGSTDEVVGEKHKETNYSYDANGNLIDSGDYDISKPSIYRTNKWWMLIHLNFTKNSLYIGSDFNVCELPQKVNQPVFLGLGPGTVAYLK